MADPEGQGSRQRFTRHRRQRRESPTTATKHGVADRPVGVGRQRTLPQLYRELFGVIRGHWLVIVVSLGLLSVSTSLKLVPPAATKLVIDNVLLGHEPTGPWLGWLGGSSTPRQRLYELVGLVFAVTLVGTLVGVYSRWLATLASKRLQVLMRRRVYEHAARLPLHRVYQLKAGGVASVLREDAGGVGELVFSMLFNPWRAIVQLLGGLAILAWVDWRLLVGAIFLTPAVAVSDRLWNKRLRPLYRDVRQQRQEIDAKAAESFGGMRVVRAFGRQRRETTRFVGENNLMVRQELFAWLWTRVIEVVWDLFLPAASGALLLFGGMSVLNGSLSLGDLMMFLVYLAMLLEPIAVLATSATQLQNNLSGFDRVLDLLAEPREMISPSAALQVEKGSVVGRITLENVGFTYPTADTPVLSEISLTAEPGEVIALVGRSGAGKTTLCNLIARFYDATEGEVRLDGIDLRQIDVESYRNLLGIVEQDVFLFDGTVAENIAYAARHADRSLILAAAQTAYADEFINDLPEGYETRIGERGVRLSGGQRQRLAIARAILADPKIFILDEATSNLDSESERLIQRGLNRLLSGRTSFVIAHRLSTIRSADRILVLDAGRIVESGTHDELMARGGRYQEMVTLQTLGSELPS